MPRWELRKNLAILSQSPWHYWTKSTSTYSEGDGFRESKKRLAVKECSSTLVCSWLVYPSVGSLHRVRVCVCRVKCHPPLSLSLQVRHFNFECVWWDTWLFHCIRFCVFGLYSALPSLFSTQAEHLTQLVSLVTITVPSYLSLSLCMCVSTWTLCRIIVA